MLEKWKHSTIALKFPTFRNSKLITTHKWLLGKQEDDSAEGLWRIKDGIYDLRDFIHKHPGGDFWIKETKGTDITEAFEAHHLTLGPEKLLEKYKIRNADNKRNYTLTMAEDGFYKTLKRRVIEELKNIDMKPTITSNLIHTCLLLAIYTFAIASVKYNSYLYAIFAGVALAFNTVIAHNYFHRKDNWRMYTFNLSLMNYKSWRISHALSHHIYPNSYYDLELSMVEPFLCWIPNPHIKSILMRYVSWILEPLMYIATFPLQIIIRLLYSITETNIMYLDDLLCLSIPLSIYFCNNIGIWSCLQQWLFITFTGSTLFALIAFNAAHHDPEIYHEGDKLRDDRDWGLYQIDTIIDRGDLKGSQFLVLTQFGEHALHHLFPTLDHGILPQLYPVLYETLDEFKGKLRQQNYIQHFIGQHKQLLRTTANPIAPGEL